MVDRRRQKDDWQRDVSLAWRTANYTRAAKLPSLEKELKPRRVVRIKGTPSFGQQRVNLQMLSEFLGRPLRKTRLIQRPTKD